MDLCEGLKRLRTFYEAFKQRECAKIQEGGLWANKIMTGMARKFLEGCGEW